MTAPRALIYAGDRHIGSVHFEFRDDAMGVAGGAFEPGADYVPSQHATELEGLVQERGRTRSSLRVVLSDGLPLACKEVTLVDWAATVGDEHGREVAVFGIAPSAIWDSDSAR